MSVAICLWRFVGAERYTQLVIPGAGLRGRRCKSQVHMV